MKSACLYLSLFIFSIPAFSRTTVIAWTDLAVTVSGTLRPLTVAINGQKVVSRNRDFESLLINGQTVRAAKTAHGSFYLKLHSDKIDIQTMDKKTLASFTLPRITKVSTNEGRIILSSVSPTWQISIDDQNFGPGQSQYVVFQAIEDNPWFKNEHTVIVREPAKGLERLYTFNVNYTPPSQPIQRVGVAMGESPLSYPGFNNGMTLFYDHVFSTHWVTGGRVILPLQHGIKFNSKYGLFVEGRGGYQFFRHSADRYSPTWLEAGAGIELAHFPDWSEGLFKNVDRLVPFVYLLSSPIHLGAFHFGGDLQIGPRAARQTPNGRTELFIDYEW